MPSTLLNRRANLRKRIIRPIPRTKIDRIEASLNRQLKLIFERIITDAVDKLKPYAAAEADIPINVDNIGKQYQTDIYVAIETSKRRTLETVGVFVANQFNKAFDRQFYNRNIVPAIMDRTFKIVTTQITPTIEKQLKQVITAGIKQGASASQIIRHFEMLEMNHRTIARTEINTAASEAGYNLSVKELNEAGIYSTSKKGWITAGDEKVREWHVQAGLDYGEGSEIPVDEDFIVGGEATPYPRNYVSMSPENLINCRCDFYIKPAEL